jgi:hypothetical protein
MSRQMFQGTPDEQMQETKKVLGLDEKDVK